MNLEKNFDVIVIGAGHAGCEAAAAAKQLPLQQDQVLILLLLQIHLPQLVKCHATPQ